MFKHDLHFLNTKTMFSSTQVPTLIDMLLFYNQFIQMVLKLTSFYMFIWVFEGFREIFIQLVSCIRKQLNLG